MDEITITKIQGVCQHRDCDGTRPATHIACGRGERGHPLGCYCEAHAEAVAEEESPEYVVHCPNCGCGVGVN